MTEAIFQRDAYAAECEATVVAVDDGKVVLDRTVFYPAGGGQPGDRGELELDDGRRLAVADTAKGEGGAVLHLLAEGEAPPATGARVRARIDWARRHRLMRHHTCLHLLCAVVGAPVTGGRMAEDKAHLDFDIEMDKLVAEDIETRLNALVAADTPVVVGEIDDAALDANPGLVKTMSVQPPRGQGTVRTIEIPGVDLQPCGGTHLRRTGEIGQVRVAKIRSEGKRNKRVTVVLD
ncbi:alanyl-tRNA editing protein [Thauera sp. CAU 1555]|uniref:Alanine--tRNA ligase n=1 Tax=Thauera sedimentorum TaxID=2767595 RepID=A0ABR9B7G3_9RHOO|nr:alanyl-tRNA editing protein [Thauera sedimentorum]MBC9071385.1 alanyl-tRNA editing protein [Thauera sedimentorum]MBD8502304.1 alanyl-tRNA editing protein [Thauera sedimentorum]